MGAQKTYLLYGFTVAEKPTSIEAILQCYAVPVYARTTAPLKYPFMASAKNCPE